MHRLAAGASWFRAYVLSTYNPMWLVGLVDAIVSFATMVLGAMLVTWIENLTEPWQVSLDYPALLIMGGAIALIAGGFGMLGAHSVQSRVYLRRSARRTVVYLVVVMLGLTTVLWFVLSAIFGSFYWINWFTLLFIVAPLASSLCYRLFGFADPAGVAEMLRNGQEDAAVATVNGQLSNAVVTTADGQPVDAIIRYVPDNK